VRPAELSARLASRPLILDGAMGSMLIAAGLEPGRAPEWWNVDHPDRVASVHRASAEAGSDVVHTNTFGASPPRLAAGGLAGRCREINMAAVALARTAVGDGVLVAGDIGPTGLFLPPVGGASTEELSAAFAEQAAALAEGGADLLSIETMSDLREARIAVEAARGTGLALIASMTFEVKRRGTFTIMGDPLVPSLAALAEAGADAVGCNCTVDSAVMLGMVRAARSKLAVPLVAQPNAGQPRVTPEGVAYDADPETFANDLADMVASGARAVGGCCGTTPAFIRAARRRLDAAGWA
jgi:5-methyltetrahydrofolate--homocysteine methyltransferase